jgi:hypothetical protein
MKKTRTLVLFSALVILFAGVLPAADFEGVLMDKMCSMKALQEGGQKAAAMHKRDCALMGDCVKSGFGLVTADNQFLAFDAEGNSRAEKALKASKKSDNLRVRVSGEQSGDTIQVKSLQLL